MIFSKLILHLTYESKIWFISEMSIDLQIELTLLEGPLVWRPSRYTNPQNSVFVSQ